MGTMVCFHAHPDDESIATAGTMARAAAAGHRVVLVVATRGERGTPVPDVLAEGEDFALRRTAETYASAEALGCERVEFLGYVDSDMMGEPANKEPWTFWAADVDQAARRLAVILDEERPDVLTVYDDFGVYGHPDHIQVHRVGVRAAELAGVPYTFQSTFNRDAIQRNMAARPIVAGDETEMPDVSGIGKPDDEITHTVDVTPVLGAKRASMLAHRSQIADDHFFLAMPDEVFAIAMGTEWYVLDRPAPEPESWVADLFAPYAPSS
jgi:LmbE family N-acetylglucosaminyl deacetylase